MLPGGFSPVRFAKSTIKYTNPLVYAADKAKDVIQGNGDQLPGVYRGSFPAQGPDIPTSQALYDVNSGYVQAATTGGANTFSGGGTGYGTTGTGTGGTGYTTEQQAFKDALPTSLENIRQTYGRDPFSTGRNDLQGSASNLFNSVRSSQTGINNGRANNELNRMNGIQDILSYVRNGMQQGASRLANANATESSASGALGRAYNQIGNQKARGVNNQAGLQSNQFDQTQGELNQQKQLGVDDFHRTRDNLVTNIGTQLRNQLSALDAQAQGLSLPDRIAVDQEKQSLIDAGQAKLQEVDQWLQDQLGTINPQSQDQVQLQAQGLRSAGQGSSNPFDLGGFGQQVQNEQNPAISQLPIFTRNKRYFQ